MLRKPIKKYWIALPMTIVMIFLFSNATGSDITIHTNKGKYKNYYHFEYALENKSIIGDKSNIKLEEGGMFELRLNKKQFPINAPNCKSGIILRMPWTDPDSENASQYIQEKKNLLDKIIALDNNRLNVVIELNPYIKLINESPLELELTRCNIFFRHAKGRYIDKPD